jgi:uncharacterized protein
MSFLNGLKRFPFRSVLIAASLMAAAVLVLERMPDVPEQPAAPKGGKKEVRERTPEPQRHAPERTAPLIPGRGRQVVIIIDDIGSNLRVVDELVQIGGPIAFAVLPHTPHAEEAARRLHKAGKEILLHLPMEPRSYPTDDPGKGALFVAMNDDAIRRTVEADIAAVPFAVGVNNHMGSRFMEEPGRLAVVMRELAKRNLFFVDSLTTDRSRGREAAAAAGIPFAVRNVFIDHTRGYAAALANLTFPPGEDRGKGKPLVMIGHPHPETVRALRDAQPAWQEEKISMITLSACLNRPGGGEMQASMANKRSSGSSNNREESRE